MNCRWKKPGSPIERAPSLTNSKAVRCQSWVPHLWMKKPSNSLNNMWTACSNSFMRTLIIALFILPLFAIAQQQETPRKKFSMGLSFTPASTYRSLRYSEADQWIADQRNEEEV